MYARLLVPVVVVTGLVSINVVLIAFIGTEGIRQVLFAISRATGFPYNSLLVSIGTAFLGATAGLLGGYMLLQKRALVGDVAAHAALPGLCLIALITGSVDLGVLIIGGFLSSLLGIGFVGVLQRSTRLKPDATLSLILGVFFGVGVLLLNRVMLVLGGPKGNLYGFMLGKTSGMMSGDVLLLAFLSLNLLVIVLVLHKEFKLIAFDSQLAKAQGWPVGILDGLLLALVVSMTVVGLPAVGVVLMAALLVIPPVTARLWTDSFEVMLPISAAIGLASGVIGSVLSTVLPRLPTGAVIVLVSAACFVASFLLAPKRGMIAKLIELRSRQQRHLQQAVLLAIADEQTPLDAIATTLGASPRQIGSVIGQLRREGLVERLGDGRMQFAPTMEGLKKVADLKRNHAIWRRYLQRPESLGLTSIDPMLSRPEDILSADTIRDLEISLQERAS